MTLSFREMGRLRKDKAARLLVQLASQIFVQECV
jgi:hypothetical protein